MKKIVSVILCLWSLSSFSAGGWHVGGGDPYAQNFAKLALKLSSFLKNNPQNLRFAFDSNQFISSAEVLNESLNNESSTDDLIVFTTDKIVVDGKEKAAQFNKETNQITINRDIWKNFPSDKERYITVAMEICGLISCPQRYESMSELVTVNYPYIESQVLKSDFEYTVDGWRIVGEDPGVFSRISSNDFIYKVATIGTGTPELKKDLEMLSGKNNADFITPLFEALKADRGSFIVFENIYKTKTAISYIYAQRDENQQVYLKSYTLVFTAKEDAFSATCDTFNEKLSILERIQNCYLNKALYSSYERLVTETLESPQTISNIQSSITKLLQNNLELIKKVYSYDRAVMNGMLMDNFFLNYSNVFFTPQDRFQYLLHSMRAHGFEPDLFGPFKAQNNYWKSILTRSFPPELHAAIKVEAAAKYLAENNLIMATPNIICLDYDKTTRSRIVNRSQVNENKPCIQTNMGLPPLLSRIESEFAILNLIYQPETMTWIKK